MNNNNYLIHASSEKDNLDGNDERIRFDENEDHKLFYFFE